MKIAKAIYSKRCWLENKFQEATVFFENGLITKIEKGKNSNPIASRDVGNCILMPGIIDAHVHVNEPGRTEWEGFETATQSAAAGGITTLVDMPLNASPVTISAKNLKIKLAAAATNLHCHCGFYGGLIPGSLVELEALINSGVLGIKIFLTHSGIDEFPHVSEKEIDAALGIMSRYTIPLLAHCELADEVVIPELSYSSGSYKAYLASRPKKWENDAIAMMIKLCRKHLVKVHIVHVSSAEALELIQKAKEEGLPITAETCPHYLIFNAEEIKDGQTLYKCAPPIREKENNTLLKKALAEGVLNFLASDHSPALPSSKEIVSGNLQKAWGGIAGLQFLLPASWTALRNEMSLDTFIPLLTSHPAKFLGLELKKGYLKEGYDADFTIWMPDVSFQVKPEDIFFKHKISPYINSILTGKVMQTYVDGILVYDDGKIIHKNAGKIILNTSPKKI